jgi:WD40 repeat protein
MVTIEKVQTFLGHKDSIYALEQSLDPNTFYSAGGDGQIAAWDISQPESGKIIAKVPTSVYALRLIKDRNVLVVGQNYEGIHLIDLESKQEIGSLKLTESAIFDIQINGDQIIVATGEGVLFVIDSNKLTVLHKIKVCDQNLRHVLVTSSNYCVVGSSDGFIRRYNLETYQLVTEIEAHEKSVFKLCEKVEDNTLLSVGRDARLKFLEADSFELDESINAHMYAINDLVFRQDGRYFATASMDKTIKIWDYKNRKLLKVIDKARHEGHRNSVNKLLWLSAEDYLISCSDDRSIGVWRINIEK